MNSSLSSIHAAAKTHAPDVAGKICAFLAAASDSSEEYWKKAPWMEIMHGLETLLKVNDFEWKVPLVAYAQWKKRDQEPWIYLGREWFFWLHTFSSRYHWSEKRIANLPKEQAYALMQEILVEDWQRREWEYGLTDLAYPYDKDTQKSTFQPLQKPEWMKGPDKSKAKAVYPKMRVPRSMMPVGPITDASGIGQNIEIVD